MFIHSFSLIRIRFHRYDPSEVEGPAPEVDTSIDEADYSVEKWKEVIWQEVKLWDQVDTTVPNPDVKSVVKNKSKINNNNSKEKDGSGKKEEKTTSVTTATSKTTDNAENIVPAANSEAVPPVKKS